MEFKLVDSKICSRENVVIFTNMDETYIFICAFGMHNPGLKTFAFHFLTTYCDTSIIWLVFILSLCCIWFQLVLLFHGRGVADRLSKRCYFQPWGGVCGLAQFLFNQEKFQLVRCVYGGRKAGAYRSVFQISGVRDEPDAYAGHVTQTFFCKR